MTTKIYHVYICDEGEVEGMFNESGELLGAWCLNDANWRNEYFNGFLQALGIEVETSEDPKLELALKEYFQD